MNTWQSQDSFQAERFLRYVREGRCGASEVVRLAPERKSTFNKKFRAVRP